MGLGGVRRKQRLAADPQNTTWKSDTSKFGYKMLTKMGWREGQGLGRNEDGSTEHLAVQFKADTSGLGVAKADATQETYRQLVAFDDVLRRISSPPQEQSLETDKAAGKKSSRSKRDSKRSKRSTSPSHDGRPAAAPSRLAHRQKFIKNKRVDQYSAEHLKEILGVAP